MHSILSGQLLALDELVAQGSLSHRERALLTCALATRACVSADVADDDTATLLAAAAEAEALGAEPRRFTLLLLDVADPLAAALEAGGGVASAAAVAAADELTLARLAFVYDFVTDLDIRLHSRRERVARALLGNPLYTYGEAAAPPLLRVIRWARATANAAESATFVDVGSGAGRALLAVALASDFAVVRGEEALESLHMVACEAAARAGALLVRDAARTADLARALRVPLAALRPPPAVPICVLRLADFFDSAAAAASTDIFRGSDRSRIEGGRSTDALSWSAAADLAFVNAPCMPEASLARVARMFGDGAQAGAQIISVTRPLDGWHSALAPVSAATDDFEWGEASVFIHAVRRRAGHAEGHVTSASQFAAPSPPPSMLPPQQPAERRAHRATTSIPVPAPALVERPRETACLSRLALARRGVVANDAAADLWSEVLPPRIRAPSVVSSLSDDVSSPLGAILNARKNFRGRGGSASDDGLSSPLGSMLQARKAAAQAAAASPVRLELSDSDDDAALSPLDSADSAGTRGSPKFLTLPTRS
jgi:hypothetical protein